MALEQGLAAGAGGQGLAQVVEGQRVEGVVVVECGVWVVVHR